MAEKTRSCPSWGQMTCANLIDKWAASRADSPFALAADGQVVTYHMLHTEVTRLGSVLRAQGLGPGDSILIRAGRRMEGLTMLLAAVRTGISVCLVPEGMSARQITEGAVSYAPKLAIDAGIFSDSDKETPRILEAAANLFTVRMVGCFGTAPDGMVDFSALEGVEDAFDLPPAIDPDTHSVVHMLRHGRDGRIERFSRTQSQLLSQALASALSLDGYQSSAIGSAYDPLSSYGLLVAALPTLMVGATLQQFDALDPSLYLRMQNWLEHKDDRRLVLPAVLAQEPVFMSATSGRHVWIASDPAPIQVGEDDTLLIDCGGTAMLPAQQTSDGQTFLRPGSIVITPSKGGPMSFGSLLLEDGADADDTSSALMNGEIGLTSPLSAARNGRLASTQPTGQLARLTQDENRKPIYVLTDGEGVGVRVGTQTVVIASINRALGLTGRWQDAAVFPVADPLLGHRIEVAVEPRAGDSEAQTLPTLDLVRSLLRESGVSDAGLPVRIHLVTRVPRREQGMVDVAALARYAFEEDDEALDDDLRQRAFA